MSWKPDAHWALAVLETRRERDPADVEMATEYACGCLKREIARSGEEGVNRDEILEEALRADREGE